LLLLFNIHTLEGVHFMAVFRALRAATLAALCCVPFTHADDPRLDHYQGLRAETLAEALQHLVEYNAQLAALLAQSSLSLVELDAVHQLTYTIENSLERIGSEVGHLAELLESVHVSSEQGDQATVLRDGRSFLEASRPLTD